MKNYSILEQLAIIKRCDTAIELQECKDFLQEIQIVHDWILAIFNEKMNALLASGKIT